MKKKYLLLLIIFAFQDISAQLGIDTSVPVGIFHVDASKNNLNAAPTSTTVVDDFIISNSAGTEGYIGIGNSSPKVKLDVRTTAGNNSAIGIGNTTLTADAAKEGALRYNGTILQYSNGLEWVNIESTTNSNKSVVIANKTDTPNIPHRTSYYFGWNKIYDSNNNFTAGSNGAGETNPTGGYFTAPRTGNYLATFTFAANTLVQAFQNTTFDDPNQIEAIWEVRSDATTILNRLKCANNFPANSRNSSGTVISTLVGSNCTVTVHLTTGQRLYPLAWVDLNPGIGVNLINDSSYNTLTIVEQ